jgi:hypothetical protein
MTEKLQLVKAWRIQWVLPLIKSVETTGNLPGNLLGDAPQNLIGKSMKSITLSIPQRNASS